MASTTSAGESARLHTPTSSMIPSKSLYFAGASHLVAILSVQQSSSADEGHLLGYIAV